MSTSSRLILASGSPRRKDLLAQLGVEFDIAVSDVVETVREGETPHDYVERLALEKAAAVLQQQSDLGADNKRIVVLGGDTSVVLDGQILGKPVDKLDALGMLACLSGRWHSVMSAICVHSGEQIQQAVSETKVRFRSLSLEECEAYWQTGEPEDKAGAYGIQGLGAAFVETIEGSYSGVVGLPLAETWRLLKQAGIATALERVSGTESLYHNRS